MTLEVRAIRESERQECLDLWCTVWSGDNSEAYFRRYFYGDVEWLPYYTQVAVEDGRLVSAVHICKRTVACGEFRLTMGGIANVATLPEYRGKGYNSACLKQAISVMEADSMDFSLLFTGINDYYARLSYETLPRLQVEGVIPIGFTPRSTAYSVRPFVPDDLPAIRAIYAVYNQNRPIAVQRTEAYWRDWIKLDTLYREEGMTLGGLYVAEDAQGVVCGYAHCGTFNSAVPYTPEDAGVHVMEFGVGSPDPETQGAVAMALLDGLAARFLASGARGMRLEIAFDAAVLKALDELLETPKRKSSRSGMVRLLHRENLLRSFTLEMNDRWILAGRPPGRVTFATPYGPVCLDATGSFLHVESVEATENILPQVTLFELLFDGVPPEEAPAAPLLTALFPARQEATVYWGADGF